MTPVEKWAIYRVQAAVAELADSGATDRWTTCGSPVRAGDKALA